MHSLKAAIINETLKICTRTKAIFFLCLTALIPIASVPVLSRFQSGFGVAAVTSADFPVLMLNVFTALILPLLIFMAAADMFAGETGDRTIRMVLIRPISRMNVFLSKQAALLLYTGLHLAVALGSSLAAARFLPDKGNLAAGIPRSILAYGTAILPMLTLGIAAVFVSQFFRNASGALTVCLLLYALAKLASFVFPPFNVYSPAAYTDWHLLWIGHSLAAGKIASIFMFLTACCILFFTAGYVFFDRKEF